MLQTPGEGGTLKIFDGVFHFLDFNDNLLWKIWPKKTPGFRNFGQ